jgi:rhamnopyranosyl-N-acetylglucosaminyl-diphospho-decaprenol beta-1,3/1,4-galactofuranosyltransferase
MVDTEKICAVVVTYNRRKLLRRCIDALIAQRRPPDKILIADNASTDGTENMLRKQFAHYPSIKYINLGANLGGGGGFHYGARQAFEEGYDWVWLMDDDCLATEECLDTLMFQTIDSRHIYSPIVMSIEDKTTVLWGIKAKIHSGNFEVTTLPFNGFLIHRDSLKILGFPEKEFFIYGDDTDFNMKARDNGKKVIMVTSSVMYHPYKNVVKGLKVYKMFLNKLWTYYKLRNAIIIYKRYRYVSINQVIMFAAAFMFYLLTVKFDYLRLWLEGLKDGVNGRLYVKSSLP